MAKHEPEKTQVCTCPDDCDCDGYGPLREPPVTAMEVARCIGWIDAMSEGGLEFSAADWSQVPETGLVTLEGRKDDLLVDVTVHIKEIRVQRDFDADLDWLDDEEDEDDA